MLYLRFSKDSFKVCGDTVTVKYECGCVSEFTVEAQSDWSKVSLVDQVLVKNCGQVGCSCEMAVPQDLREVNVLVLSLFLFEYTGQYLAGLK